MLVRRFGKLGYLVESAENGEDALELIALKKFDVVLLDVMMPGIDGMEVLRRIRHDYSMVELPVIMVTAKGRPEDMAMARSLGAVEYITKPWIDGDVELRVQWALAAVKEKQLR